MRRDAVTLAVAAGTVAVVLDAGSYGVGARTAIGAVVVAALISSVLLGGFALTRPGALAAGLLGSLAVLAMLSATWAADPEMAFADGTRVALYAGVFVLAAGVLRSEDVSAVADGLAIGITAVAVVALASRWFPDVVDPGALPRLVPAVESRLSYPVQYWNGLGMLLAAGIPLLVRLVLTTRPLIARALALAGVAASALAVYYTSSRGAVLVALVGLAVLAVADGRLLAPVRAHLSRRTAIASGAGLAAAAVLVLVLMDPAARWERFTSPPDVGAADAAAPGFVSSHLTSGTGSGRWQFWSAAADAFRSQPIEGRGAGSYASWWAEHGTLPDIVRDAHALGLQTLAELGLLGGIMLLGFSAVALVTATRALGASPRPQRTAAAALLASASGLLLGMQVDWVWNIPAVAAVALLALAVLCAPGALVRARRRVGGAVALLGVAGLALSLVPWLTLTEIDASREAAADGDTAQALDRALSARRLQPWAASPRLQEALVRERGGDAIGAAQAIAAAIERDPEDWRTRLVAARLQAKAGHASAADASLRRAERLAPRHAVLAAPPSP
jgi:O-antigen ligase